MSVEPSSLCRVMPSASSVTFTALAERWTAIPSASNALASSALASGSSAGRSRSSASMTCTSVPKRANAWASSAPIGPLPRTSSERGSSRVSVASRLVQ